MRCTNNIVLYSLCNAMSVFASVTTSIQTKIRLGSFESREQKYSTDWVGLDRGFTALIAIVLSF